MQTDGLQLRVEEVDKEVAREELFALVKVITVGGSPGPWCVSVRASVCPQ